MKFFQNLVLVRQARKVLALLTMRDKTVFWLLVVARFAVNLMDIAGISLMAVAVNFLIADPNSKSPLSGVFAVLGMHVDARGSKLPALFALGLVVVGIFIFKAVLSLYLMAKSANQISSLEIKYSKAWMAALSDSQGRFNALALKEDIGYVVTAGSYSIFQRTLVPLGTVFAETAGLVSTIAVLVVLQPLMTAGVLVYFGLIGVILQNFVGRRNGVNARRYTQSHVAAVRTVRETIENEKALFLSGRKEYFLQRFAEQKTVSSQSQAQTTFLNNFPRYVVETALIVGAFGLAGGAFVLQDPLAAATTLTFFLTSATRMTPALLNVMTSLAIVSGAESDTVMTERLLGLVGQEMKGSQ
jgi:ABC-type multidrug transport system fused ATPase/permease subunit